MAIPKDPHIKIKEEAIMSHMRATKEGMFKYYDVESGTEKTAVHGADCPCGTCSKARLKSVLDDIIKDARAFAPTAKRRSSSIGTKGYAGYTRPLKSEDFEDHIEDAMAYAFKSAYGKPKEPDIESDEGKCFGWNPLGEEDILCSDPLLWAAPNKFDYGKEVYMAFISDKPMSPDMTKNDMAVMSVDQAKAVLTLKVLYNPFFNQRLKERIEPKYRNWNPTNKCWELHPSKMKDVQQICGEFYKGVQIIGQKPVLGTKFEKLLSHLTKEDKASIYRLMALKYHPDKGGSHEVMSLLNEVFKQ